MKFGNRLKTLEEGLIKYKTQSFTTADSANLYRLWIDFSDVHESRKYTIEVAPIHETSKLIIMPLGGTGVVENVAAFSCGLGLDFENPRLIRFRRTYASYYPRAASSVLVYSNAELYIKNISYYT